MCVPLSLAGTQCSSFHLLCLKMLALCLASCLKVPSRWQYTIRSLCRRGGILGWSSIAHCDYLGPRLLTVQPITSIPSVQPLCTPHQRHLDRCWSPILLPTGCHHLPIISWLPPHLPRGIMFADSTSKQPHRIYCCHAIHDSRLGRGHISDEHARYKGHSISTSSFSEQSTTPTPVCLPLSSMSVST